MLKNIARALLMTALLGVTLPVSARTGVVKGSYVNLRSEGRFNSPIIGRKMRGDTYHVTFEDGKWLKVVFEDKTEGWLYQTSTELAPDAPPEPPPVVATASAEPDKKAETVAAAAKTSEKSGKTEKAAKDVKTDKKSEKPAADKKADDKKSADDKADKKNADKKAADEKAAAKKAEEASQKDEKLAKPIPASVVEVSGSAEELYNEAIRLYEKKQYVQALDKNLQAIKKAPLNAEILNNVGNCQFKLGKIDEALESWKEALKISPRSGKISNNLGIAYYQLDKNKDAVEFYKKAILFEPDFPDPYYNLGSVYGFTGKFEDAILNYRKFLEFSPDNTMKKLAEERIAYCERHLSKAAKKTGQ